MRDSTQRIITLICVVTLLINANLLMAQKGGAAKPSGSAPSSSNAPSASTPANTPSGGGSGLQGYSYTRDQWNTLLAQMPKASDFGPNAKEKDIVFVCYRAAAAQNAATPFILENASLDATPNIPLWQANHLYTAQSWVYSSLDSGHYYEVLSSGMSGPDEPTFPTDGNRITETGGNRLVWQDMGKLGYSPFVASWSPRTQYSAGDLVRSMQAKGRYFQAQNDGVSGDSQPQFEHATQGQTIADGPNLHWTDMGDMASHGKHECASVTSTHPLLMNQNLVVAVDMIQIPETVQKRFTILNFNVTSQAAGAINPTPIQPSISAGTTSVAGGVGTLEAARKQPTKHQLYYLTWPNLVTGDTITTINVNLVYTPVAPALPWESNTFYPAGSIVVSDKAQPDESNKTGHYYLATNSGISGNRSPAFPSHILEVATFPEGTGVTWKDMGQTPPSSSPPTWTASTLYGPGDIVIPPSSAANGHFYRAVMHAKSGTNPPDFSNKISAETFPENSDLFWTDMGILAAQVPVPPTSVWTSKESYHTGDLVIPPGMVNGHYYRATVTGKSGQSDKQAPSFPAERTAVDDGPKLSWLDMGPTLLTPAPAKWSANTPYAVGATVVPEPPNGHYYQVQTAGVSGPNPPPFPVDGSSIAETQNLVWMDSGTTLPSGGGKLKKWAPNSPFVLGDTIQDTSTAHYYTVIQAGISGATMPNFSIPTPAMAPEQTITWVDLGTTLPASVTTGQPQPSDQTVSAITYSFPQSHQLSYFTLTSGVVWSSIQTKTFVNGNPASASTPKWQSVNNGHIVDPILALVAYIKPVDTERAWRFRGEDLIPGATIAFSLSSPANNFYFGGSSGILNKNIQVSYGLSVARISVLQPASLQLSGTTPATRSQFAKGGFVGISFNILGFITSLPGL
jgi:hypothetical protein